MATDIPPWLAQPANPAVFFHQGFAQGAQIGAQAATERLRKQQLDQQAQQAAVEMQQRAIEFSLKMDQQQQELAQQKQRQEDIYEIENKRIAEEAARTQMYGEWHQGEIARKGLAGVDTAAAQAEFTRRIKAGEDPMQVILESPGVFPTGMPAATVAAAKAQIQPQVQVLPGGAGQPPVRVITGGGGPPKQVTEKTPAVNKERQIALNSLMRDIISQRNALPKVRGKGYSGMSDELIKKQINDPNMQKYVMSQRDTYDAAQKKLRDDEKKYEEMFAQMQQEPGGDNLEEEILPAPEDLGDNTPPSEAPAPEGQPPLMWSKQHQAFMPMSPAQ